MAKFGERLTEITGHTRAEIFGIIAEEEFQIKGTVSFALQKELNEIEEEEFSRGNLDIVWNLSNDEFIAAISSDGKEGLEKFYEKGFSLNQRDKKGETVLFSASLYGMTGTVKFLLEEGADPDKGDFLGRTPLMLPAGAGDTDTVETLLRFGADPYLEDKVGRDVFEILRQRGEEGMINFIQERYMRN